MTVTAFDPTATGDLFRTEDVSWVLEKDDLRHLLGMIRSAGAVVFDLETTGLAERAWTHGPQNGGVAARVVLASFTLPEHDEHGDLVGSPTTYLVPLSHPDSPWRGKWRAVMTHLARAMDGRPLVGHNVKFDLRYTEAVTGVDLSHSLHWDTLVSAHLLEENGIRKLKVLAAEAFRVDRWDDFELNTPGAAERAEFFQLGEYAARDTYWTWRVYALHRSRMTPDPDADLFGEELEDARLGDLARHCAMPMVATLTAMEQRGMALDAAAAEESVRENEAIFAEARADLVARYVDDDLDPERSSFAATSNWFIRWAELAVQNGDLRIAELTPTGKPRWSKEVLTRQARHGSEVAATLLTLRQSSKRLEYLRSWLAAQAQDGRVHSTYNAGSVVTGRLSSSDPNMQQVTKALRPTFVPSPGHYLVDLDYSQIELRVAAFISRCEPMMTAFRRGEDLHRLLAARISNKPLEDVTPDERQKGKSANFGLLYGMGVAGFQGYAENTYGVVMSEEEARVVHEAFFTMWDGIRQWHARQVTIAHRDGQVSSPIGRVRRLPGVWDANERVVAHEERNAINSPVQGFASDIMQIAAACIEGLIPGVDPVPAARLVGTVHDSIIVEVPVDGWEAAAAACKRTMEREVPFVLERMGVEFDVPLVADASVGTRWSLTDVGEL